MPSVEEPKQADVEKLRRNLEYISKLNKDKESGQLTPKKPLERWQKEREIIYKALLWHGWNRDTASKAKFISDDGKRALTIGEHELGKESNKYKYYFNGELGSIGKNGKLLSKKEVFITCMVDNPNFISGLGEFVVIFKKESDGMGIIGEIF